MLHVTLGRWRVRVPLDSFYFRHYYSSRGPPGMLELSPFVPALSNDLVLPLNSMSFFTILYSFVFSLYMENILLFSLSDHFHLSSHEEELFVSLQSSRLRAVHKDGPNEHVSWHGSVHSHMSPLITSTSARLPYLLP